MNGRFTRKGLVKDRSGHQFGGGVLHVLSQAEGRSKYGSTLWHVRCDRCGQTKVMSANQLRTAQSCGCWKHNFQDRTGQRCGPFLVLRLAEGRGSGGCVLWNCLDMRDGKEKVVNSSYLQRLTKKYKVNVTEKYCKHCDRVLPAESFSINRRALTGLNFYCRECTAIRHRTSKRKQGSTVGKNTGKTGCTSSADVFATVEMECV